MLLNFQLPYSAMRFTTGKSLILFHASPLHAAGTEYRRYLSRISAKRNRNMGELDAPLRPCWKSLSATNAAIFHLRIPSICISPSVIPKKSSPKTHLYPFPLHRTHSPMQVFTLYYYCKEIIAVFSGCPSLTSANRNGLHDSLKAEAQFVTSVQLIWSADKEAK